MQGKEVWRPFGFDSLRFLCRIEILAKARMKSALLTKSMQSLDERNSVLFLLRKQISLRSNFIHQRWISSGQRTDFTEKKNQSIDWFFFSGGDGGSRTHVRKHIHWELLRAQPMF